MNKIASLVTGAMIATLIGLSATEAALAAPPVVNMQVSNDLTHVQYRGERRERYYDDEDSYRWRRHDRWRRHHEREYRRREWDRRDYRPRPPGFGFYFD